MGKVLIFRAKKIVLKKLKSFNFRFSQLWILAALLALCTWNHLENSFKILKVKSEEYITVWFLNAINWILTCKHNLNLLLKYGEPLLRTVPTLPIPCTTLKTPSNSLIVIYEDCMIFLICDVNQYIIHVNTN